MLLLSQFIFQCKVINDGDVDRDGDNDDDVIDGDNDDDVVDGDNDDDDSGLAATNVGIIYVQYIHLCS